MVDKASWPLTGCFKPVRLHLVGSIIEQIFYPVAATPENTGIFAVLERGWT